MEGPVVRRLLPALAGLMLLLPGSVVAQDAAADPLPEPGTTLAPGRYVSRAVGPTIDFRVEDGWRVGPAPPGPIFTLERTDQPGTVLSITRFDGDTYLDSCDPSSLVVVEDTVGRLMEIIGGNPYLNPGPPQVVDVDGQPGLSLDVAVPAYTECHRPFVLLWAIPIRKGGEFVQVADQQSRFIVLDVGGDVIVIAIESFPGVPFGGLLEASLELVDSMRIEPGEYIAPEPTPSPAPTISPQPSQQAETAQTPEPERDSTLTDASEGAASA
jgi:hypothetical protein